MKIFSTEHLLVICITLLLCIVIPFIVSKKPHVHKPFSVIVGSILLLNIVVYQVYRIRTGYWGADNDLPMHLCAWANVITAIALFTRNTTLSAIAWCWVMMGSINGLITPQLENPFPEIPYIYFVIGHSGLMIAVSTLVYGIKIKPTRYAWVKVVLFSQVYFFSALLANSLTQG
ncbi:MAG: TIGR02206 family membrane protein, partial [Bacteroidota bacterium]